MDRTSFEKLVSEALDDLPRHVREKMDNVAVVVCDRPSEDQIKKGGVKAGTLLLGLYEGVPKTKRGPGYTLVLPDKITIFQECIEQIASTPEELKSQVRGTIWHEVAHHFGFDEEGVRKLAVAKKS